MKEYSIELRQEEDISSILSTSSLANNRRRGLGRRSRSALETGILRPAFVENEVVLAARLVKGDQIVLVADQAALVIDVDSDDLNDENTVPSIVSYISSESNGIFSHKYVVIRLIRAMVEAREKLAKLYPDDATVRKMADNVRLTSYSVMSDEIQPNFETVEEDNDNDEDDDEEGEDS